MTDPAVPEHIRAAIYAGHVGQVVIFCDGCGDEVAGDYIGETREARFVAARRYLAENKGWLISPSSDHCPPCASGKATARIDRCCDRYGIGDHDSTEHEEVDTRA